MKFTDLYAAMHPYCLAKVRRDAHKPDPMLEDEWDLIVGGDMERFERKQAFNLWQAIPSEENGQELLKEIADEINYLMFLAGKVMGVRSIDRS